MLLNPKTDKYVRDFVERKLIVRLRIFFFVIFILLDIIIYEMSIGYISAVETLGALLLGFCSGYIFVRRKRIYWEEETSRVIARMDKIGIALLVIYIAFFLGRHWLLRQWLHGHELTAFAFSFAAGAMIGRVFNMRLQIRKVLKHKKII